MKKKTISIGGATYDLFIRTKTELVQSEKGKKVFHLPIGDKIRVENVIETCGGGASNTSTGLSRLGCDAKFCGVVANDQWGEKLIENLKKEGVDTSCATIVDGEVSSFSIILSTLSGERTILYEPGTNEHLHDANFSKEVAAQMNWIYLNHIQESSSVIQDDIIEILTSDESVCFTWNPGGCQIDVGMEDTNNSQLLSQANLVLLNKKEALEFTKTEDINDALKKLIKTGAQNVCITNGSNGTTASDGENIYHCPVIKDTKVVDTTGAGDAFGTGVTWALVEGLDLPTALRAGTINASSVVGAIGAQTGLLTETKMKQQLETVELHVSKVGSV